MRFVNQNKICFFICLTRLLNSLCKKIFQAIFVKILKIKNLN